MSYGRTKGCVHGTCAFVRDCVGAAGGGGCERWQHNTVIKSCK